MGVKSYKNREKVTIYRELVKPISEKNIYFSVFFPHFRVLGFPGTK